MSFSQSRICRKFFTVYELDIRSRDLHTNFTLKDTLFWIANELDIGSRNLYTDFTLKDSLFGAVKLTTNANHGKYFYSVYCIWFD